MSVDWENLLASFLHDPPDKALEIPHHEDRAAEYANAAGVASSHKQLKKDTRFKDWLAAETERLPMPWGQAEVDPENGQLTIVHPLSGQATELECKPLDKTRRNRTKEIIAGLVPKPNDFYDRFLILWRLLPQRLAAEYPEALRLPAETRQPDHTIWHHLDTAAGLAPCFPERRQQKAQAAFLSFQLGPVQPFIEAARTVRDLWTGSAILSWLTFQALLPIVEELGPTAVVYPSLRGMPLLDHWLRRERRLEAPLPSIQARRSPCLPHRFLAVVPHERGGELADECRKRAKAAWLDLAAAVHAKLKKRLDAQHAGWDRLWQAQIDSFFDFRTVLLPWEEAREEAIIRLNGQEALKNAYDVRSLLDVMPKGDLPGHIRKELNNKQGTSAGERKPSEYDASGLWQARVEMTARLMEAHRAVRHIPGYRVEPPVPLKCSVLGSYEQMGPADLRRSNDFWKQLRDDKNGLKIKGRLGEHERLCAVALTKRFAAPVRLLREYELECGELVPDTATVAAARWLEEAGIAWEDCYPEWDGEWLHWPSQKPPGKSRFPDDDLWRVIKAARRPEALGPPPLYYAVLKMDADEMGRWLRGEKSPLVRDVCHDKLREYFERLSRTKDGLCAKRPVSPALHAAISEALANFALYVVPGVVARHRGFLIYAGGDDVLALLPTETALACALELRAAFRGEPPFNNGADKGYYRHEGRDLLVMGTKATLSAGLAVAHYKDDLQLALREARQAERAAKDGGRDALQVTVCRRSGPKTSAFCDWATAKCVERWRRAFGAGASDRWTYHLGGEAPTLAGMPLEKEKWLQAICAEIRQVVNRAEEGTRRLLGGGEPKKAGEAMAGAFRRYFQGRGERAAQKGCPWRLELSDRHRGLGEFLTLCQAASFLARGRER